MCNTTAYKDYPLWFPRKDNVADLETGFIPTGGWEHPMMKQYSLDDPRCGEKSVDSNYRED